MLNFIHSTRSVWGAGGMLAMTALLLAGCAGSPDSSAPSDAEAASKVPRAARSSAEPITGSRLGRRSSSAAVTTNVVEEAAR